MGSPRFDSLPGKTNAEGIFWASLLDLLYVYADKHRAGTMTFVSIKPERERFFSFVMPEPNSGCWLWVGATCNGGYGRFRRSGPDFQNVGAHRYAFELANGPIPEGLHIDHRCSNPTCVNPDHLDAVTPGENLRRTDERGRCPGHHKYKTHCQKGHPYSGGNLYIDSRGIRHCRTCKRHQTYLCLERQGKRPYPKSQYPERRKAK